MHEESVADARKKNEKELVWQQISSKTMDFPKSFPNLDSWGQLKLTVEASTLMGSAQENCSLM